MKRKILLIFLLIGFIPAGYCQTILESIDLSTGWKMKTGDDFGYAKPELDDNSWKDIRVGENWETQVYPDYDGIVYYRLRVVIPSAIKKCNNYSNGFLLSLGKINDWDVTYFNGVRIGETNGLYKDREYLIPEDLIHWDKENVIAVRVNDIAGRGGLYAGPYTFGKCQLKLSNFVTIINNDKLVKHFPLFDSTISKTIIIRGGKVFNALPAEFRVKVFNAKTNKVIADRTTSIVVGGKADSTFTFSVKLENDAFYKASFFLSSKYMTDTVSSGCLLTYKKEDRSYPVIIRPIVPNLIPSKSVSFDLNKLHLNGYLGKRINANITERLLNIDETGILECFYNRPGNQTWVGEYAGKYLHAAARAWNYSKNEQLKIQMDRIVDILISCQNEDGYLGTYLPDTYWTEWDVWAHKYDLLGLLSYYAVTGYQPAIETSKRIGDLLCRTFGTKPGQINIEETGNHVGMASCSVLEPMVELYRYTNDKKYLDFCNYIIEAYEHPKGPKIISTLNSIGKVNKTANAKAYEMMSNFTGIVKLYQLTGETKLISAMEKAWKDISDNRLYITGTSSQAEHFQDDFVLPADNSVHMGEGCVSTTWLQFNQAMYFLTGEAKYVDEIEKTIYNHLLAAENPITGCVSYYTALQGAKPYRCTIDGHCCLASIPRGIAAIAELAYTKNAQNGFIINLYTSGYFNDNVTGSDGTMIPIEVLIKSQFPEKGTSDIIIKNQKLKNFNLALRVPVWCKNFIAKIGNTMYKGIPGAYLMIKRNWTLSTTIHISFDLNVQSLNGGKSYPGYMAIKNGAQILAFDKALNPGIDDIDKVNIEKPFIRSLPVTELPKSWFGNQVYSITGYYNNKPVELKLVPFAEAGQSGGEVRVWLKKQ